MTLADTLRYAAGGVLGYRARGLLMLFAMAIGVASVLTLTALGDGARRYVNDEFSALGTHLLIILPGRSETTGGPPPLLGETPRDLTLDDALALRRIASVRRVAPVSVGSAPVSHGAREREVLVLGTTSAFRDVRHLELAAGRFIAAGDPRRASPECVLGAKLRRELFGREAAVGRWVRIGDRRYRVVGVLASAGRSIGVDLEDVALVPVASAQALFDSASLFRVLAQARSAAEMDGAKRRIQALLRDRHDGEDDVTVITQDALLATFDRIFRALTLTVGGIAAISLVVAGILIMNVMLVAVAQRTAEIGLLKALGAPGRTVMAVFLAEAVVLSGAGAGLGVAVGLGVIHVARTLWPALPFAAPPWAVAAAVGVALAAGGVFGIAPARRAAALDPVAALGRR